MDGIRVFDFDEGLYLCRLIACALRGVRCPDDAKPESVSWHDVFDLAKLNSVEAVTWMGLPEHPTPPIDADLSDEWRRCADMTLFRQLQFDAERERIAQGLVAKGISFLALKGASMSVYYPSAGMRSMSDNDILYGRIRPLPPGADSPDGHDGRGYEAFGERRSADDVREVMLDLGYTLYDVAHGEMDFVRSPMLTFEMFQEVSRPGSEHHDYYANPWRRTSPRDAASFEARKGAGEMCWPIEDEYLFHLVHMFKHWEHGGGCGIRFVVDAYVYDVAMHDRGADAGYVRGELEKLDLVSFERRVRGLAALVFGGRSASGKLRPADFTDEDAAFLRSLLTCGIYGNLGFKVKHDVERSVAAGSSDFAGRLRYLWSRIFPSRGLLVSAYPWLEGRPWLIPFMPVYRLARGLALHRRKVIGELRALLFR